MNGVIVDVSEVGPRARFDYRRLSLLDPVNDLPKRLVKHLVTMAQREGLTLTSLNTYGASLEDAFVKFTEGGLHES